MKLAVADGTLTSNSFMEWDSAPIVEEYCMQAIAVAENESYGIYIDEDSQLIVYHDRHDDSETDKYVIPNYEMDDQVPLAKRRGGTLIQYFDKFAGQALSIGGVDNGPYAFIADFTSDNFFEFDSLLEGPNTLSSYGSLGAGGSFVLASFSTPSLVTYTENVGLVTYDTAYPTTFDLYLNDTFLFPPPFSLGSVGST